MRLNTIKLLTTLLSLTGTMALSTGCTKSGFSAESFQADLSSGSSIDKLRRRNPTTTTTTTTLPISVSPVSLKLLNLPDPQTTLTSASIDYSLTSADSTVVVFCRLDSYDPIVCPKPFNLGFSSPLDSGMSHSVDYYLGTASGLPSGTQPTVSYSWSISGATTPPALSPPPPVSSGPALLPAYTGLSSFSVDAPDDTDQAAFVASGYTLGTNSTRGYSAKGYSYAITDLSQYPTITNSVNGGGPVFGPSVVDGLSVLKLNVRQGEALRYNGARSSLNYDIGMLHGHDYWISFALKLGPEWTTSNSGGYGDRQNFFNTHQVNGTPINGIYYGNPFSFSWIGNSDPSGAGVAEFRWIAGASGNDVNMFKIAAQANTWTRVIIHYRSGPDASFSPIVETWIAFGNGDYVVPTAMESNTTPFGDPTTSSSQPDWPTIDIYKWTTGAWGGATNRTVYNSGLYFGEGANLLNEAKAAIAAFAK